MHKWRLRFRISHQSLLRSRNSTMLASSSQTLLFWMSLVFKSVLLSIFFAEKRIKVNSFIKLILLFKSESDIIAHLQTNTNLLLISYLLHHSFKIQNFLLQDYSSICLYKYQHSSVLFYFQNFHLNCKDWLIIFEKERVSVTDWSGRMDSGFILINFQQFSS